MISQHFIDNVRDLIYREAEKYNRPALAHLDIANEKGQHLAKTLNANKRVVLLGTLLMDAKLGESHAKGIPEKHIEKSIEYAAELLCSSEITKEEREDILTCIKEHHGAGSFSSLESEIVCNADCYRFLTIKGVVGGFVELRRSIDDLINLFEMKTSEKWSALTLDICKHELDSRYRAIKQFLRLYSG